MMLSLLLSSLLAPAFQEPAPPADPSKADFEVRFDGPARALPAGLGRGINDLSNASAGCWQAWGEHVQPDGGLARIWLSYAISPLGPQIEAGQHAAAAGMEVFLVAVGAPENQGKGHGSAGTGIPPKDALQWAERVAKDVRRMRAAGAPVSYVEVWNEPDFPGQWNGTQEEFAAFFARAGRRLKELIPDLKVGGPGMAGPSGNQQDYFRKILTACKRADWSPDYLSYHFYGSYASDNERCEFASRIQDIAAELGLGRPEMILSEWNIGLPKPVAPQLDDHRAGVYFAAMNSSLASTPVQHSLFFFLQDGYWEAKEDYAGQSVGLYTLRGGPKAVLNGMRMFRQASSLPVVPVERQGAPWNLTCLASREGDRGYLLLTNSTGDPIKRARLFVDWAGVDMSDYAGKERQIQAWAAGRISYERMGGLEKDREIWEEARRLLGETREEEAATDRTVRLAFQDLPRGVSKAWLLSEGAGDPAADEDFRVRFDRMASTLPKRAGRRTLEQFRAEPLDPTQLEILEDIFTDADQESVKTGLERERRRLGSSLTKRAGDAYRDNFFELRSLMPVRLSKHEAAQLYEVPRGELMRREGDELVVELPPWSAALIEVYWGDPAREQD